ncbi:MAG: general stress protein [Candidatus Binatia bacterium]
MTTDNTDTTLSSSSEQPLRDMAGRSAVGGLFPNRLAAERAVHDLQAAGFTGNQIGVAMRDRTEQNELMADTGTQAAESATTGAIGGSLLGGLAGLLVGIGVLAIPGIGPVVAGGLFASAFGVAGGTAVAGAGIGAAAGGLLGALAGMGIPEIEAHHFETGFRSGHVLVVVNAGNRALDALAILEDNGADTGPKSMSTSAATADVGIDTGTTAYDVAAGDARDPRIRRSDPV